MTLQWSHVSLRFDRGLDTKTDARLVDPPYLTRLENGVFTRSGSIKKRNGYAKLSQSIANDAALTAGSALAVYSNELLLFDDLGMYSYSQTNEEWVSKGTAASIRATKTRVISNDAEQLNQDMAICGNIAIYAWEDSRGGCNVTIKDLATGVAYLNDFQITTTGVRPKCFKIGQYLFVSYIVGADLRVRRLACATPTTIGAENTIVTDVNATDLYDVANHSFNGAVFAYSTIGSQIVVGYITPNGFLGNSINGYFDPVTIADDAMDSLTIITDLSLNKIYVGYDNGTEVRVFARHKDLTEKFAPVTLSNAAGTYGRITGAFTSSTSMTWFYHQNNATNINLRVRSNTLTDAGVAGTDAVFKRSVGINSKAWSYNGKAYVTLGFDTTLQSTYFTFSHDGKLVGKHLGTIAGGETEKNTLPRVEQLSTGVFVWAALEKGKLRTDANKVFTRLGVTMLTLDFLDIARFSGATLGGNIHFNGGLLQSYDGDGLLLEHGFMVFPEGAVATPSGAGGSMATGTYSYKITYEWTDATGQIHRSAPTATITANVTGPTGSVAFTIPTLRLTSKSRVQIVVYRTALASSAVFYRVSSITSPIINSTTADTVAFTDTLADASITANQILYTSGGILDNDCPPSCSVVVSGKQRLFLISDEDGTLWYSKKFVTGEGVAFSLAQQIILDGIMEGVRPTALAILDDKVIIFDAHRIFAFAGDGPNDLGQQDDFTSIELINSDVGLTNPASLVRISGGLMFQSSKGIYMLNSALELTYVGAPVEQYNDQTITSAVLIADTNQVRFTTEASVCLVYDYFFQQWSTFTNHAAEDAIMWQNTYAFLRSTGVVELEQEGVFNDDGSLISMLLETAWVKLAQLQGWHRARSFAVLGEFKSDHTLIVDLGYDYNEAYLYSLNFLTTAALSTSTFGSSSPYGSESVYGGNNDVVYQFRDRFPRQKCESIRFRIRDDAGSGESYSLSGLDLEVGLKRGLMKLRAEKTI